MYQLLKQRHRERRAADACSQDGFTLAEAIVSIVLFTIAGAASLLTVVVLLKLTWLTTVKVDGTGLARDELEKLRILNASTSTPTFPTSEPNIVLHNVTFTVTPNVAACANAAAGQSERKVTITVQASGDTHTVSLHSVLTC